MFWSRLYLIDTLCEQERLDAAEQSARDLLTGSASEAERAWANLKLAEVDLARLRRQPAIDLLRSAIDLSEDDAAAAEPRNWAQVRLAETLTHESRFDDADQVCDDLLSDHAAGRAGGAQAVWALIWKARTRMFTHRLDALAEAPGPAKMAAALAVTSGHPELAYEAQYLLGEIYDRLAAEARRLVKEGEEAYAASPVAPIVEDTRRAQDYAHEGEWGPLMVEAMEHYGAAMGLAEQFQLGRDKAAIACLPYAARMHDLGMRDKALATWRMGLRDPAKLTEAEGQIAQTLGSYLHGDDAEAWHLYLTDPTSYADPTTPLVQAAFGTTGPGASTITPTNRIESLLWLGRLFEGQKRLQDAATTYEEALAASQSAYHRAQAQDGIARCALALTTVTSDSSLHRQRRDAARESARKAAAEWNAVISESTGSDTHWAIERAIDVLWDATLYDEAAALIENIAHNAVGGNDPRKAAFAMMKLAEVYWGRGRWAQASAEGKADWDRFGNSNDAVVQEACIHAMFIAHVALVNAGDLESARSILDTLEQAWPEKLAAPIARKRAVLAAIPQGGE